MAGGTGENEGRKLYGFRDSSPELLASWQQDHMEDKKQGARKGLGGDQV